MFSMDKHPPTDWEKARKTVRSTAVIACGTEGQHRMILASFHDRLKRQTPMTDHQVPVPALALGPL